MSPRRTHAHCCLGDLLESLGKDADAEAKYREAIRVNPKDAYAQYKLGDVLEKLRKDAEAAASYGRARRSPVPRTSSHWFATILKKRDDDGRRNR